MAYYFRAQTLINFTTRNFCCHLAIALIVFDGPTKQANKKLQKYFFINTYLQLILLLIAFHLHLNQEPKMSLEADFFLL